MRDADGGDQHHRQDGAATHAQSSHDKVRRYHLALTMMMADQNVPVPVLQDDYYCVSFMRTSKEELP